MVPAVAVADELESRGHSVSFLGSRGRAEERLVPEAGYEIDLLSLKGIDRRNPVSAGDALLRALIALPKAAAVLRTRRASVVLGGGGFVAGPAGLAALGLGLPIVLTEADSHLGLTNRLLAHRAEAVCLAFPIPGRQGDPFEVTGRPLPSDLLAADRVAARRRFSLQPDEICLLVVGGSLGARSLNLAAVDGLADLQAKVIHVSGKRDFDLVEARMGGSRSAGGEYTLLDYEPGLGEVLAACDLVIGRSGGSVFEFCAAGKPALLVPYPHATGDHQVRNAEWMVEGGAAQILPDAELSAETLSQSVSSLIGDRKLLEQMGEAARALAVPDATERIADTVESAARGGSAFPTVSSTSPSGLTSHAGRDLTGRELHFVGIGGAGMSALAAIASARGASVTGSDRNESPYLERLRGAGVEPTIGHDEASVPATAEVVVSSAIDESNPEIRIARSRSQRILHRGELLAEFSRGKRLIAVSGTHGKTTTTAMISHLLSELGLDPCFAVGGEIPDGSGSSSNARWGGGDWMVTEADESDGSFLELDPELAVVTNLELDHHSRWTSLDDLRVAFEQFASQAPLVVQEASVGLDVSGRNLEFEVVDGESAMRVGSDVALAEAVEVQADTTSFRVRSVPGLPDGALLRLSAVGRHNVANALAAISALGLTGALEGVDPARVSAALESFPGVGRRLEWRGRSAQGALLYDDYAHHPTEVAAVLEAARQLGARRLVALFQPHLFSRTKALSVEFGRALAVADEIGVLEVYPAREEAVGDLAGVTGRWIAEAAADAAPGKRVWWLRNLEEAVAAFEGRLGEGDLLLTIGAGDVNSVVERLQGEDRG